MGAGPDREVSRMRARRRTRWAVPAAGLAVLLPLLIAGCPDLSRLKEPLPPLPESPTWYPREAVPDALERDAALDGSAGLPDVAFPDLDVTFDALADFSLAAVQPSEGKVTGGDVIMLVGNGFHEGMDVYFDEALTLDPFVVNTHYATVESPPGAPGPVDIRIRGIHGQEALLHDAFTYVADLYVQSVDPGSGPAAGGTPTLLSGTGFSNDCSVYFSGRKSPAVYADGPESLQAVTPPGNCGPADVTVLCDGRKSTLANGFLYQGLARIDRLYPKAGGVSGGYFVHLEGRNFTPNMTARFGDVELGKGHVVFFAPTLVDLLVPPGQPGPVSVELVTDCGQTLADPAFIYVVEEPPQGPPSIIGVLPTTVPACAGGPVTLAVQNLGDPGSLDVFVGEEAALVLSVNEDVGILDVMLPPGPPGPAVLLVSG
ncbi:MAG: hypothetical protein FJ109_18985, partial [Deltaproteobacteria bacterium]|nr:hypothetical protein [Deltaproteobacteria bacterium]